MRIDLHMHSNCSDGSLPPRELVKIVKQYDVKVMALTDHDTVAGIGEALAAGVNEELVVVPGVELSIDYPLKGKAHLHLLGLFIDPNNEPLKKELDWLRDERSKRGEKIIRKLQQMGIAISPEELSELTAGGSVGRPHVAQLLVRKGYVSSAKEAFLKYLSKDGPAYVPKEKLQLQPAIDLIHQAGGLAILAHPISLGFPTYDRIGQEILLFKEMGLDGLEAYYSSHDRYFTEWLLDFAKRNEMLVSGGSDFHGEAKPDIKPGVGLGDLNIPMSVYENLVAYHRLMVTG